MNDAADRLVREILAVQITATPKHRAHESALLIHLSGAAMKMLKLWEERFHVPLPSLLRLVHRPVHVPRQRFWPQPREHAHVQSLADRATIHAQFVGYYRVHVHERSLEIPGHDFLTLGVVSEGARFRLRIVGLVEDLIIIGDENGS